MSRVGKEIRKIPRESGRNAEACGIHVIFHVVRERLKKHNRGIDFADDCGDLAQEMFVVEDFEIARDGRMQRCAKHLRSRFGFIETPMRSGDGIFGHGPAGTVGYVH